MRKTREKSQRDFLATLFLFCLSHIEIKNDHSINTTPILMQK
jgi:hypothetical protein